MYYNIYVYIIAQMMHMIYVHFPIVVEIEESFLSYLTSIDSEKDEKQSLNLFLIKSIRQ